MTNSYTITTEDNATLEDVAAVRDGLEAYNRRYAPDGNFGLLHLFVRDDQGAVVGGLLGVTYWGWLYVEVLWLSDGLRRQGWGSRLLGEAERVAVERGCHSAHLDTMDFQARPFYELHGYTVFGILDDLPMGHQRIFLQKKLAS